MTQTFTAVCIKNVATIGRTLADTFNLKSFRKSDAMTSNIARCSDQDFYTRLARVDSALMESCTLCNRRPSNLMIAAYNNSLHRAMGYRADQPEY